MKFVLLSILVDSLASCAGQGPSPVALTPQVGRGRLRLIQTIPLPNVEGRIDYLSQPWATTLLRSLTSRPAKRLIPSQA